MMKRLAFWVCLYLPRSAAETAARWSTAYIFPSGAEGKFAHENVTLPIGSTESVLLASASVLRIERQITRRRIARDLTTEL